MAMIVVCRHDQVLADLTLHTNAKTVSEWRSESTVDAGGQDLCWDSRVSQCAKWPKEKESRRLSDYNAGRIRILLRREP